MNETNPTLKKAYKLLKKITKKLGDKNLHFSAQIGISSENGDARVTYAAMIAPPAEGLDPVTFASENKETFIQNIQDFLDEKASAKDVEVVYHQAQILMNDRSSQWHKEQIDAIENPAPAEPIEAEIVSEATPTDTEETLDSSDAS